LEKKKKKAFLPKGRLGKGGKKKNGNETERQGHISWGGGFAKIRPFPSYVNSQKKGEVRGT